MPMVTMTGRVTDAGQNPLPVSLDPRIWLRPNQANVGGSASVFHREEVPVEWVNINQGTFTVELWSEPNDPNVWYTLVFDHLVPGQETEPPGERARAYSEWPYRIYPDVGGALGDLVAQVTGTALVYCASDAPNSSRTNQLHFDTDSNFLYERVVTW